ncbi:MAG: alpha/beta hydrolase [Candidatus Woesearchaeota archaeon]
MKRVIIVHGWSDNPEGSWFPWLKRKLEEKGFRVEVPAMPDTNIPRIDAWVSHLARVVGKPDKDTFLVGHSIGCQTIMRYLEKANGKVGGVLFVGGWFTLKKLGTEEQAVANPWLETPINTDKVKSAANRIIAIFCDDDEWVPVENAEMFRNRLNAEIIIETGKGHFTGDDGVTELPEALEAIEKLSR